LGEKLIQQTGNLEILLRTRIERIGPAKIQSLFFGI
jgi:hypothetical protein